MGQLIIRYKRQVVRDENTCDFVSSHENNIVDDDRTTTAESEKSIRLEEQAEAIHESDTFVGARATACCGS